MRAIRMVFIVLAPMMGVCLVLCLLIKDRGLQRPEEREEQARVDAEAAAAAAAVGEEEKQNVQNGSSDEGGVGLNTKDGSARIDDQVSVPPDKVGDERV